MLNSLKGLLSRKNDVPSPTVISLGQVWVDIMMDIDAIPQPGGFAVANHTMPSVGGSFRVMQAASRIGAATKHAGVIGNGPWASLIRKALNDNGIEHIGQDRIDADSGFRLVLNDSERKTFVATYGAESQGNENTFDCVEPGEGDVVHISANTLMDHSASGIDAFLHRTSSGPDDARLQHRAQSDQHAAHGQRPPAGGSGAGAAHLVLQPSGGPHARRPAWRVRGRFPVDDRRRRIRRLDEGAVQQPRRHAARAAGGSCGVARRVGAHAGRRSHPCGGYPTKATHTRSAGSCHTGAMCALIARGWSLVDAVKIANAAASLGIQRSINGVPTAPAMTRSSPSSRKTRLRPRPRSSHSSQRRPDDMDCCATLSFRLRP